MRRKFPSWRQLLKEKFGLSSAEAARCRRNNPQHPYPTIERDRQHVTGTN
jgi:hypothetical protein